jgi:hypothetical protein
MASVCLPLVNKIKFDIDKLNTIVVSSLIMTLDWQALTKLTGGARVEIERVRLPEQGVAIDGRFELPPLAQLTAEDQVFVAAFVRCHGSIKNRLNKIGSQLSFVEIEQGSDTDQPPAPAGATLDRLSRGELTVEQALEQLKGKQGDRHE